MKKNLRVFVSSFMVGVMTATSTAVPGLSAVATFASDVELYDAVESGEAIEVPEVMEPVDVAGLTNLLAGKTSDLAAGAEVASNDNVSVNVAASQADGFVYVEDDPAVDVGGTSYTSHYNTGGTNTASTSLDGANTGTYREALEFDVKADGVLVINCKVNKKKIAAIVTGTPETGYTSVDVTNGTFDNTAADAVDTYKQLLANVKAGDKVLFVGKGTNVPVYGVYFKSDAGEETKEYDLADPEKGKTYTADFSTIGSDAANVGSAIDGVKYGDDTIVADAPSGTYIHGNHGAAFKPGDKLAFKVAGDAKISMVACFYGSGQFTVKDSKGNVVGTFEGADAKAAGHEAETDGTETAQVIDYKGEADTLTVTFDKDEGKETYVHKLSVKSIAPPVDYGLAAAEEGKTYTADFVALDATTDEAPLNGMKLADGTMVAVASAASNIRSDAHGTTSKPGDKFVFNVAGDAKIKLTACVYGHNTWTLTDEEDNVLGTFKGCNKEAEGHDQEADGSETAQVIDYKGPAKTLILTYDEDAKGETYVHKLEIEHPAKATGVAENFSIWFDDLATEVDSTDSDGNPTKVKTFDPVTFNQGEGQVLKLVGSVTADGGLEKFTPNNNNAAFMNLTRNGKTVNAYKAGPRFAKTLTEVPVDINDQPIYMDPAKPDNLNYNANNIPVIPQDGDGTALEFTCVENGTFVAYVFSTSFVRVWDFDTATGKRIGYTDGETGDEFVAFSAKAGHTYVLSTTGKTNNCGFCGAEFAKDEEVTITVDQPWETEGTVSGDSGFTLVDAFLGTTVAKIDKDTTSVTLNMDHTYDIKSADPAVGVSFAGKDTDRIKIDKDTTSIKLKLVEIPDETLTGNIITSDGKAASVASVKFVNMISGAETPATLSADGTSYTAQIKPGDYNTVVDVDGYTTIDKVKIVGNSENKNDIYLKADDPNYIDLTVDIEKTEGQRLQYINNSGRLAKNNSTSIRGIDGDQIIVPVAGGGKKQKVTVAGWYSGEWNINGKNSVETNNSANAGNPTTNCYFTDGTETSVTINFTGNVNTSTTLEKAGGSNYLYWVRIDDVDDFDANNTVIQVPSEQFPTLKAANAYIATLNNRPEGEAGRMTIELTADIEEQIVFTEPYITVKGNGHTISWYYGVGSFYYSIDKGTGLYDEELFYDKYNCNEADGNLWGGVAIIRGDHFIAENTVFKNTYNYEVTEKDAADFDHATGGLTNNRVVGAPEVSQYANKERSNAFYIDADDIQVYNCKILSTQDTFGRNGSANNGYHVYVKDSVIGGNVDYICGEFTAVFDNCELQWKTYTDDKNNTKIGYITAAKTSPYVFRNCVITKDSDFEVLGAYGRTWGQSSNAAFLFTQTNNTITEDGWGEMTAGDGKTATFYDYANFNGDDDAAPAKKFASELPEKLEEAYTTDKGIIDILTFTPVNFMYEADNTVSKTAEYQSAGKINVLKSEGNVHTAEYEIGNDTIVIAAVPDLKGDGIILKSKSGKVIGQASYVYDSIKLADDYTITAEDLGFKGGYLYAMRVVGVRSAYMSADGNSKRESDVEGFKVEFVTKEVADEAKKQELEPVDAPVEKV